MRYLSSVGLALSIIFGCLLLALLAELYYLLWSSHKKRPDLQNDYSTPQTKELLFILCCSSTTSSSSPSSSFSNPKPQQQQAEYGGLAPRFLFTIMEETAEEMESEDGVSIKGKSLNDLFLNMESGSTSPYLTPRASPSLFTPPFTPLNFFESSTDAEFNRRVRSSSSPSSPLSRFKFLRDAEEKLHNKKVMEIVELADELKG